MRPTFDLDGTNTPNVATIPLGAGQNVTNANFGYQGRASLAGRDHGRVTGLPIPGATVVVVDSLGTTQTVTTGLSGNYNIAELVDRSGDPHRQQDRLRHVPRASPTIVTGANTQD